MKHTQNKQINQWIKEYCIIYNLDFTKELKKEVYDELNKKYEITKEPIISNDIKEVLKEK